MSDEATVEELPKEIVNLLDEDVPIYHLLDVHKNPAVKDMTTDQLNKLITRLRTVATSPQTLTATLQKESRRRPKTEAQIKRQALLDSL